MFKVFICVQYAKAPSCTLVTLSGKTISFNALQPENAYFPIVSTALKPIELRLVQPLKTPSSRTFTLPGNSILSSETQSEKHFEPMLTRLPGKETVFSDLHFMNASLPISVTPSGISTLSRRSQSKNALSPIFLSDDGSFTLFTVSKFCNAFAPISVTGYFLPSISAVSGITILSPLNPPPIPVTTAPVPSALS